MIYVQSPCAVKLRRIETHQKYLHQRVGDRLKEPLTLMGLLAKAHQIGTRLRGRVHDLFLRSGTAFEGRQRREEAVHIASADRHAVRHPDLLIGLTLFGQTQSFWPDPVFLVGPSLFDRICLMTAPLACQRPLFDLPPEIIYLNCAYMSPSLRTVTQAGEEGVRRKSTPWQIEPRDFFSGADRARDLFAPLIGAKADDIAIVPSASYGIATAAANVAIEQGQSIVIVEDQFPSNVFAWRQLAQNKGARIITVARPDSQWATWSEAVWSEINETTAVVALPHCHWTDGALFDLEGISARCRAVGAALVLDLSQSLGALPIDVRTVGADFIVSPCYKWLLGPYSLGFLYVAPRHQNGIPLEQTWIGRRNAEDFARLTDYVEDWDLGARRFDMGARPQLHLMPMACAALEQITAWEIPRIAATLGQLTRHIADHARALGLATPPEGERAPHFIGVRFPSGMPEGLLAELKQRNIYVSARADSLRITPHLYNDDYDIDMLFDALKELM